MRRLINGAAPFTAAQIAECGTSSPSIVKPRIWPTRAMEARAIIGWNLRRLRVELGLSQERLALAAGIDRAYVGRVERGSENVTITTLEALATVLRVPVADLLTAPTEGQERPQPLRSGRRRKAESGR